MFIHIGLEFLDTGDIVCVQGVVGDCAGVLAIEEFNDAIDEIAEVIEEFGVVFCNEVSPEKLGVGTFRAGGDEVVAEC